MSQKNVNKFLAGAVTATMVATAVVTPAMAASFTDTGKLPEQIKGEVDRAVELGYFQDSEKFNPAASITRGQVALVIARQVSGVAANDIAGLKAYVAKHGLEEKVTPFADVKKGETELYYASLIVKDAGAFTQDSLNPASNITRSQMAKVVVTAFDLKMNEDNKKEITDIDKVSNKEYIEILASNGVTEPQNGKFNPGNNVTRSQMASFLVRAHDGVKEEVKEAKVESVSAINASEVQVKFSTPVNNTATEKANYQLKVNNNDIAASDIANISLSKDGKVATILLKQNATTKGAFQNGDKYVIQTNDGIKSKDGKALEKFVSEELTFSQTAAPSLNSIVKSGDNLILTFDRPVNAIDNDDVTLVKIDGIEIGSKELKPVSAYKDEDNVVHSDVLGTAGDYRYKIAIDNPTAKAEAKKVGTHEVVIFDVEDTASDYKSKASVLTGSYTITDAVTTPEVTGIEAVNANRFFVYTNVPVTLGTDAVITVNKGSHEFKLDSSTSGGQIFDGKIQADETVTVSDAEVGQYNNKDGIWVVVTDNKGANEENPLYRTGEASVNLSVTVEKYTADGLIGKKSTQNVTLNKNNTKPVVDTTVLKEKDPQVQNDKEKLVVKFTNALRSLTNSDAVPTLTEGTDYVVRDSEGIIVTGFGASVSDKEITFTHNTQVDLKDAPYTVEFKEGKFKNAEDRKNVKDYLANTVKNDAFTVTVGKEASSDFKYTQFKFDPANTGNNKVVQSVDENSITFTYPTKMNDSARNVANYTLDGKALPAGTTVDFVNDRTTVKVVFPKGTFKTSTQYKFGITTNVKTETGSMIVGSLQTKAPAELVFGVRDNVKPELASAIYYVGTETANNQTKTKQIEVTFNEAVKIEGSNAEEDFAVVINGSRFDVDTVTRATLGDNTDRKLVLTLKDEVNVAQAATITIVPESEQPVGKNVIAIKDIADNKAKEGSQVTLAKNNYKYSGALASIEDQARQAAADTAIAAVTDVTDSTKIEAAQAKIDLIQDGTARATKQNDLNTKVGKIEENLNIESLVPALTNNLTFTQKGNKIAVTGTLPTVEDINAGFTGGNLYPENEKAGVFLPIQLNALTTVNANDPVQVKINGDAWKAGTADGTSFLYHIQRYADATALSAAGKLEIEVDWNNDNTADTVKYVFDLSGITVQ